MKIFNSFSELLNCYESLSEHAGLYADLSKWDENPKNTPIIYLEGDNEFEDLDEEMEIPVLAVQHGVEYLIIVPTLQDILLFQKERKPDSTIDEYLYALNWYLETDDFYDPD